MILRTKIKMGNIYQKHRCLLLNNFIELKNNQDKFKMVHGQFIKKNIISFKIENTLNAII
jgi:hypothetical protein